MEVVQHDYYYWRLIHYFISKGYDVLDMDKAEVWLEDDTEKTKRILRIVRLDADWANALKKDMYQALRRFEFVRKHMRLKRLVVENIYVSVYPPVDSFDEIMHPHYAGRAGKTTLFTTLVTKNGNKYGESARDLHLLEIDEVKYDEQMEEKSALLKERVIALKKNRRNEEMSLFYYGKSIAVYVLLFMIVAMFFILEFNGGSKSILTLITFGAKYNPLIVEGEWWRFITAMFLHIGFLHLFMNSIALYYLGDLIERMYGTLRFVFIYFIAGLFGSVASFAFNEQVAAGASGAIFGCFGALLYFGTVHRDLFFRTLGRNVFIILGINLIFGFTVPMIDNGAHLGGLIGGFLAAAIVHLPKHGKSFKQVGAAIITIVALAILLLFGIQNDAKKPAATLSLQIGQEYIQKDEVEHAYPYLMRAVEADPHMPEALFLLAYAEASMENFERAKHLLLQTIEKRPTFHEAHYNLALVLIDLGEMEQAKQSAEEALILQPNEQLYIDLKERLDSE